MLTSKKGLPSIWLWAAMGMIAVLAASGCATAPRARGPALEPAPLPAYTKGTTFVYDDGTWEKVAAAGPETVTWINQRGDVSSGSPDFTRRRAKWQTKKRQGTRTFAPRRDILAATSAPLWPLRTGNATRYSEIGSWSENGGPEKTYQSWWSCEVTGTERVSVMAGEFDTWKIECRRYSVSGSRRTSNLREVKTWYYAPEVGHYVLAVRTFNGNRPEKRRELLAVLPEADSLSPAAKEPLEKSFQQALEFRKSGQPVRWSRPQADASGWVVPAGTFRLADGTYCRQYIQNLDVQDHRQKYYGLACRDARGIWSVPR